VDFSNYILECTSYSLVPRKTFINNVIFYNKVPREIPSELLWHSSMNITQAHYVELVQRKVSDEMKNSQLKLLENNNPLF